jgi:hypothetical protein
MHKLLGRELIVQAQDMLGRAATDDSSLKSMVFGS